MPTTIAIIAGVAAGISAISLFWRRYLGDVDWSGLLKDKSPEFIIIILVGLLFWKGFLPIITKSAERADIARDQATKELESTRKQAFDSVTSARRETLTEIMRVLENQELRVVKSLDARDEVNRRATDILAELQREIALIGARIK